MLLFLLRITGKKDNKELTISGIEFIRRFLMHVPQTFSCDPALWTSMFRSKHKTHFMPESSRMQKYLSKLRQGNAGNTETARQDKHLYVNLQWTSWKTTTENTAKVLKLNLYIF